MSNLKNILPQVFQCSLLHDVHSELSNGFDSNYVITEDLCCHFGTNKKKKSMKVCLVKMVGNDS